MLDRRRVLKSCVAARSCVDFMRVGRRQFMRLAGGAIAVPFLPKAAKAQAYPSRPVRLVCGFAPGGSNDLYSRLIGQFLSERLGQQFVVENRAGAAGSIATSTVAKALPDGYTLLLTSASDAFNTALYDNLNFDYVRDIVPICSLAIGMATLVVNSNSSINSVSELIAFAINNPGKINVGTGGVGTFTHVAWAIFAARTGINTIHVPYRGEAPAISDLLGDQVQVVFPSISPAMEHIRGGRLRALAVTGATRAPALPNVPTIGEFVPGYEVTTYWGVGAPINTPAEIVERLNKEIVASINDQRLNSRIVELGDVPYASSTSEFTTYVRQFTDRWGRTLREAGIKAS
jgi:tripartite-type tricarboxylate transporter receptor subunit TctC